MTLYMFQTVFPSIIRNWRLYIQQQAYVTKMLLSAYYQDPASKTERPSETCRVSFQNKIKSDTLVHLVGFTTETGIIIYDFA